ncbi:hypothetical protein B9Z55_013891 [Caenorhabditis nigoni]|uniref:Uncharacterized protein n=1 Tax=Caenorhabditis nigoni TaxID=1611254 RepID=A0A2G5U481_9PELO|nr:hypothetical protein B9Z55_013891 [Caenorhabditis nigoni]
MERYCPRDSGVSRKSQIHQASEFSELVKITLPFQLRRVVLVIQSLQELMKKREGERERFGGRERKKKEIGWKDTVHAIQVCPGRVRYTKQANLVSW